MLTQKKSKRRNENNNNNRHRHWSRANPNGNMRKLSRLLFTEIIKRVKCAKAKAKPSQLHLNAWHQVRSYP